MNQAMDYQVRAESGPQVLARLACRPDVSGLDQRLLGNGPSSKDVIEVTGEPSVGKSMLLLQWVSRAILSQSNGGLGVGVLFIDTDHHQPIYTLVYILEAQIKCHFRKVTPLHRVSSNAVELAVKDALTRLTILNVYDSKQLASSLLSLDKILHGNSLISLVVIDSLSAYYWADRLSGGMPHMDSKPSALLRDSKPSFLSMDLYLRSLLMSALKSTQEHKVPVVFSRPSYFQSVSSNKPKDGSCESTIVIQLNICDSETHADSTIEGQTVKPTYTASVRSAYGHAMLKYQISQEGFIWI